MMMKFLLKKPAASICRYRRYHRYCSFDDTMNHSYWEIADNKRYYKSKTLFVV